MTHLDRIFQRVTDKPCIKCVHYVAHDNPALARCDRSPDNLGFLPFADAERADSGACGLVGNWFESKEPRKG